MYDMDGYDRHADSRDKKRDKSRTDKVMRGNRSVFTIQSVIAKKGREARRDRKGEK